MTESFLSLFGFSQSQRLSPEPIFRQSKLTLTPVVFGHGGYTGSAPAKLHCIVGAHGPTAGQFTSLHNPLLLQMMGTEVTLSDEAGKAKAEVSADTKADKLTE